MSRPVRRFALLLAVVAGATLVPPVLARPAAGVQLQLIDRDSGRILPTSLHRGQRWIAGNPGQRYAVRLTNHAPGRVLVVLSVDGVNAITGETASPAQTGYVLQPGQSADISGWRKSRQQVAAFHFTNLTDSYAARTGRAKDVGVIGIAVFHEQMPRMQLPRPIPLPPPIARERGAAAAAKAASPDRAAAAEAAAPTTQSIGTGHGQREYSPVRNTSFVRATSQPAQVLTLRYDSPRNLLARGIRLPRDASSDHVRLPREPRAFPAAGFVPDPR